MNLDSLHHGAVAISVVLLLAALICAGVRIGRGAGAPDWGVALDMLSVLVVAARAIAVHVSGSAALIVVARGLARVAIRATVACAGFIERGSIYEGGRR